MVYDIIIQMLMNNKRLLVDVDDELIDGNEDDRYEKLCHDQYQLFTAIYYFHANS